MNIFAPENIGRNTRCLLEKDGVQAVDYVKWIHARVGDVVTRKVVKTKENKKGEKTGQFVIEKSSGWKILEVGVQ